MALCLLIGCDTDRTNLKTASVTKHFRSLQSTRVGVEFSNSVVQNEDVNFFTNQYVFNGGENEFESKSPSYQVNRSRKACSGNGK